jgi:hypothetical protein
MTPTMSGSKSQTGLYAYNPAQVLMSSGTGYKQTMQINQYNSLSSAQNPQKYHNQYISQSGPHPQYGNYTTSCINQHGFQSQNQNLLNYQTQQSYGQHFVGYQNSYKENKIPY